MGASLNNMQIKELGHVVLYVTNLKKIADFYKNILGFNEIARKDKMAFFSSGRNHHETITHGPDVCLCSPGLRPCLGRWSDW